LSEALVIACIPAYNEEETIGKVVIKTKEFVDKIIVCDDGSEDYTGKIAEGLGAQVIRHEKNFGYGKAIQSLFIESLRLGAEIVVTLDGDGQHDPLEIPILLERMREGDSDIVIGSRFKNESNSNTPGWRKTGINVITNLSSGGKLTDATSGFRAYNKRALNILKLSEDGMGVITEILLKAEEKNLKIDEVPVNITYHRNSSTHNPVIHGFEVMLSTLKYMSIKKPLLFYGVPGLIALCLSAIFGVRTLLIYQKIGTIFTNVALVTLGSAIIGLILMTTALILWVITSIIKENEK
jgi:glycosyltransferase involved in cell wall biosynthesis